MKPGNLFQTFGLLVFWATACSSPPTEPGGPYRLRQGEPEAVGFSRDRLSRLDGVIERAIRSGQTPGAVVLVARQGRVVYRKAFGRRATRSEPEAMTPDTLFDLASLTKVVSTATAVMMLVEEGALSLYDRVSNYLPEFTGSGKEKITMLQLMTHYSGLRPDVDLDEPWTGYETALKLACAEVPSSEPGEQFVYSDINYFVAAEVVRRVSGLRIDRFARQRIFEPLGMHDTMYNPPEALRDRIAPTEVRDGTMLRGRVHDPTTERMGGVAGHAGLFSTVDDIAVWAQMILNMGVYDGTRILAPLSVLKMTTPQSPPGMIEERGVGFDISSRFSTNRGDLFRVGSFGHTGFTGTSVWIDPDLETFVLLFCNRLHPDGKGNVVGLRRRVASVVAASIVEPPPGGGVSFYRR